MTEALRNHWPEYLIEAWGLGMFMVSACVFGVLFYHPQSQLRFDDRIISDVFMGLAMGVTAIGIILSPWGKRSGAHINPAVTWTFYRLGKVKKADAVLYTGAQFAGGTAGVLLSWLVVGRTLEDAAVNFVVTVPGSSGTGVAFAAEFIISFLLMSMILITTNSNRLKNATPYLAGVLVACFIIFEAVYSGMSMNPARTFGSAVVAGVWTSGWIYFAAPVLAMLAAAEIYVRAMGRNAVHCAKYHHHNRQRCIFCGKPEGEMG